MIKRKKYIIGNWKLNNGFAETTKYFTQFNKLLNSDKILLNNKQLFYGLAPSYLSLALATKHKISPTQIIAQDVANVDKGSYTSQVSCSQLKDLKIKYAIIGHSETRKYLGVTDAIVNAKAINVFANKMIPIICIGESLDEYNNKLTKKVLANQIKTILQNIDILNASKAIIAYEPLWAIGSGKTPTFEEIAKLAGFIRKTLTSLYDDTTAKQMVILYGGSVNENNAVSIIKQPNVDGLLIGGVSLYPDKFFKIIRDVKNEK